VRALNDVDFRRRLLAPAIVIWILLITFLDWLTMSPGSVPYVESKTHIPLVAIRDRFHNLMSAPPLFTP
jgi:hypothetical protein